MTYTLPPPRQPPHSSLANSFGGLGSSGPPPLSTATSIIPPPLPPAPWHFVPAHSPAPVRPSGWPPLPPTLPRHNSPPLSQPANSPVSLPALSSSIVSLNRSSRALLSDDTLRLWPPQAVDGTMQYSQPQNWVPALREAHAPKPQGTSGCAK